VKAVVWHGVGDIRAEEVPDPKILEPGDAYRTFDRRESGWLKTVLDVD
jgi:Alcohol dehydrogenase GroES-associated